MVLLRYRRWYSPYLLACYDPDTEELQSVCRVMSGFSDQFYKDSLERWVGWALPPWQAGLWGLPPWRGDAGRCYRGGATLGAAAAAGGQQQEKIPPAGWASCLCAPAGASWSPKHGLPPPFTLPFHTCAPCRASQAVKNSYPGPKALLPHWWVCRPP